MFVTPFVYTAALTPGVSPAIWLSPSLSFRQLSSQSRFSLVLVPISLVFSGSSVLTLGLVRLVDHTHHGLLESLTLKE